MHSRNYMNKKAYIDPLTDYLLHDPENISGAGALGRGALTSAGIAAGGGAGYGLNKLLKSVAKTPGNPVVKFGLIGGGLLGGGLLGHTQGDKWLKRSPLEQLEYRLEQLTNKVNAHKVEPDSLPKNDTPPKPDEPGLIDRIFGKEPKKSKWEQVWENLKKKTGEVTEPVADKLNEWLG